MPTPAVNLVNEVTRPGKFCYQNVPALGGNTVCSNVTVSLFREERQRPASVSHSTINGWRTPTDWFHRWLYVRNIGGDVTYTRVSKGGSSPLWERWERGGGFYTSGPSGSPLTRPLPLSAPSWLQSKCEIGALQKLQLGNFNLGVFLAEGKEAIHTVASTMEAIACQVNAFRRSNPKKVWDAIVRYEGVGTPTAKREFRRYGGKWLSLQYGWRPLMGDVLDALGDVEKLSRTLPPLISVEKSEFSEDSREFSITGALGSQRYLQKWRHGGVCRLWYRLRNPTLAELASLGLLNPAEIIWEKLPYSFVVDWFVPVGSWLSALGAPVGFDFHGGCYSVKDNMESEQVTSRSYSFPSSDKWQVDDQFAMTCKQGQFRRSVYTSSPVPGLYLKNPLSLEHLANATALLSQAFR